MSSRPRARSRRRGGLPTPSGRLALMATPPAPAGSVGRGLPFFLDQAEPVGVHFFRGGKEVAPDAGGGGEVGQGAAEGLDDHPAVVADLAEGAEGFVPGDVAGAGGAAVVFGDVDVDEAAGDGGDGGADLLLLD